jgi:hypothetical protein
MAQKTNWRRRVLASTPGTNNKYFCGDLRSHHETIQQLIRRFAPRVNTSTGLQPMPPNMLSMAEHSERRSPRHDFFKLIRGQFKLRSRHQ